MNQKDRDLLKERRFTKIETEFRILKKIVPAAAGLILFCIAVFFGITISKIKSEVDNVIKQGSLKKFEIRGKAIVDSMEIEVHNTSMIVDSIKILKNELESLREFNNSGKRHIYIYEAKHNQIIEPPFGDFSDWDIIVSPIFIKSDELIVEIVANAKKKDGHWLVELYTRNEDGDKESNITAKAVLIYLE